MLSSIEQLGNYPFHQSIKGVESDDEAEIARDEMTGSGSGDVVEWQRIMQKAMLLSHWSHCRAFRGV